MGTTRDFFRNSALLDQLTLRQLSHVNGNWELTWNESLDQYQPEDNSYASKLNYLIGEIEATDPPLKYHDNEDRLAEYVRDHLNWNVRKHGNQWIGADYPLVLQQGSFQPFGQLELMNAAAGRIKAAIMRGQLHFDDMEQGHRKILADVLAIILYHRADA